MMTLPEYLEIRFMRADIDLDNAIHARAAAIRAHANRPAARTLGRVHAAAAHAVVAQAAQARAFDALMEAVAR